MVVRYPQSIGSCPECQLKCRRYLNLCRTTHIMATTEAEHINNAKNLSKARYSPTLQQNQKQQTQDNSISQHRFVEVDDFNGDVGVFQSCDQLQSSIENLVGQNKKLSWLAAFKTCQALINIYDSPINKQRTLQLVFNSLTTNRPSGCGSIAARILRTKMVLKDTPNVPGLERVCIEACIQRIGEINQQECFGLLQGLSATGSTVFSSKQHTTLIKLTLKQIKPHLQYLDPRRVIKLMRVLNQLKVRSTSITSILGDTLLQHPNCDPHFVSTFARHVRDNLQQDSGLGKLLVKKYVQLAGSDGSQCVKLLRLLYQRNCVADESDKQYLIDTAVSQIDSMSGFDCQWLLMSAMSKKWQWQSDLVVSLMDAMHNDMRSLEVRSLMNTLWNVHKYKAQIPMHVSVGLVSHICNNLDKVDNSSYGKLFLVACHILPVDQDLDDINNELIDMSVQYIDYLAEQIIPMVGQFGVRQGSQVLQGCSNARYYNRKLNDVVLTHHLNMMNQEEYQAYTLAQLIKYVATFGWEVGVSRQIIQQQLVQTIKSAPQNNLTLQIACNMVYYSSLLRLIDEQSLKLYQSLLVKAKQIDQQNEITSQQLFLAHRFTQYYNGVDFLPQKLFQAVKATPRRRAAELATQSALQRQLYVCLNSLINTDEYQIAMEQESEDGLIALDIVITKRQPASDDENNSTKIAVLVNGPFHYYCNGPMKQVETFKSREKLRLLQTMGWKLVTVPYFEWCDQDSDIKRSVYLSKQLQPLGVQLQKPGFVG